MSRGIIVLDAGHGQFGNPYPILENKMTLLLPNYNLVGKLETLIRLLEINEEKVIVQL